MTEYKSTGNARFDLDEVRRQISGHNGPRFWMGVDELVDQASFRDLLAAEFPSAAELIGDPQRRQLLKLMGASLLLAGLGACTPSNSVQAQPYVNQPETMLP
ncbi:MAG: molybdopterin oxidoreductase, iron-sulfur binding subunit, partial [Bradyrhizobium sp.]|nr:molybdopterin oxidoreductase, iron-sulfur binding subunit [Bradyrhizobium sp.]